jgi:hypothetical protein
MIGQEIASGSFWPCGVGAMATCEVCGNVYDRTFEVILLDGERHVFDSFECAIQALAPSCERCGCRVIGHGVEAGDVIYCGAHCARASGEKDLRDSAP